jgi:hypothetical protein
MPVKYIYSDHYELYSKQKNIRHCCWCSSSYTDSRGSKREMARTAVGSGRSPPPPHRWGSPCCCSWPWPCPAYFEQDEGHQRLLRHCCFVFILTHRQQGLEKKDGSHCRRQWTMSSTSPLMGGSILL